VRGFFIERNIEKGFFREENEQKAQYYRETNRGEG
jgi:hypothetical protein